MLHIVHDGEGVVDVLGKAWREHATFIVASKKSAGIDLDAWRELIPADLHQHHFALSTSGSTGLPKLVIGQKRRAEQLVHVLETAQHNQSCSNTIVLLPLSYSFALINQWLWSHTLGRGIHLAPFHDPAQVLHALSSVEASMVCLVGAQVPLLVAMAGAHTFPKVHRVHFAGGPFPQASLSMLEKMFPKATIYNNYGCAEALPRLTLREAKASVDANHVGWPIAGVRLRVTEDQRVQFKSDYACVAMIEEGQLRRADEWLPSGDLGEMTSDGGLRLHGRADHVLKRYGEKVPVDHCTQSLGAAACVSAVSYVDNDAQGEAGYVVVFSPRPDPDGLSAAQQWMRQNLRRAQWPLRLETIVTLPTTENGKLDVQRLREQAKTVLWPMA